MMVIGALDLITNLDFLSATFLVGVGIYTSYTPRAGIPNAI